RDADGADLLDGGRRKEPERVAAGEFAVAPRGQVAREDVEARELLPADLLARDGEELVLRGGVRGARALAPVLDEARVEDVALALAHALEERLEVRIGAHRHPTREVGVAPDASEAVS